MTREILFRGFHECENGTQIAVVNGNENSGEWVFGYFWTNEAGNCFIKVIRDLNGNFVGNPTTNDYEVIPETVGQYIKSLPYGDKVFSNSKLEIISSVKGENGCSVERIDTATIRFNPNHCEWELKVSHNGKYKRIARAGYFLNNSDTKVIGTIFDKEGV